MHFVSSLIYDRQIMCVTPLCVTVDSANYMFKDLDILMQQNYAYFI